MALLNIIFINAIVIGIAVLISVFLNQESKLFNFNSIAKNEVDEYCKFKCDHCPTYDDSSLKLVNVLFRHGDRTVDDDSWYPNDPYQNETYYPYGKGQLLAKGKKRMFGVGTLLRRRYNNFLGDVYLPDILDARSTDYNRTKCTLELVLAGLYPPKGTDLEWNKDFNWNPIPYNFKERSKDNLILIKNNEKKFFSLIDEQIENSIQGREMLLKYKALIDIYVQNTGKDKINFLDILLVWTGFKCYQDWGFKLPSWATDEVVKLSEEAVADYNQIRGATAELKQISGGPLLRKMLTDSYLKMKNKLIPEQRKLFIYSVHDGTIVNVLHSLNAFFPPNPPYGAHILVELHEIDNVYGIKTFYHDWTTPSPKSIKISGCDYFCPYEKFVKLLKDNIPSIDDAVFKSVL